jgi:hypothetical protein
MPMTICRHLMPTGRRCGSPAVRDKAFCFYHGLDRRHPRTRPTRPRPAPAIVLPALDNRASIQESISILLAALGDNRLDPRKAGKMLYGLQLASTNAGM